MSDPCTMHLSSTILIALSFLSSLLQSQAFVASMSRGVLHPNQTIIFDERTFKNPRLLYAICDASNKCRLEHDREPYQRPTDTCQVNLESDNVVENIRVVPFGDDKAILVWMERADSDAYFNLLCVRFGDCSTHKVNSSFDHNESVDFSFQPSLAARESFCDVIFANSKLCGDKYCKMTIDFETNQVRGPAAWTPVDRALLIADVMPLGSEPDRLLVVQFSGEVSIVNCNDRRILKQRQSDTSTLSYSISNNLIGICELSNSTLSLSQFNHSATRIFKSSLPIDSTFVPRATYNLPDGGMLVLLNKQNTDSQRILKLHASGAQIGRLDVRIKCNNKNNPRAAQFFDKNGEYCVSLACFDNANKNKNNLKLAARCFVMSDIRAA